MSCFVSDFLVLLGKKGKKKKGKTLNLNEFLSTGDSKQAATFAKKKAIDIDESESSSGKKNGQWQFECWNVFGVFSVNIKYDALLKNHTTLQGLDCGGGGGAKYHENCMASHIVTKRDSIWTTCIRNEKTKNCAGDICGTDCGEDNENIEPLCHI